MGLTQVNSGGIEDGSIVNADIKSDSAIALSKLASTPAVLTGSTNNTVATVTGANAIQGEANLTFDGNNLDVSGGCITTFGGNSTNESACIKVGYEGSSKGQIRVYGADASTTGSLEFKVCEGDGTDDHTMILDGSGNVGINETTPVNKLTISNASQQTDSVGNLQIRYTGSDGANNSGLTVKNYKGTSQFMQWSDGGVRIGSRILTNSGAGNIYFTTGSDSVKAVLLASNGNLELSAGNLVVGNGKGIDFSADGNAGGMTNELLDDYEEGTHTITQVGSGGGVPLTLNICNYTKIGNICHVHGLIDVGASSGSSSVEFSLPFTSKAQSGGAYPRTTFALMHKHCNIHDSYKNIVGYVGQNENYWRIYNVGDNMDWHQFLSGDFTANSAEILFSVTYMTA